MISGGMDSIKGTLAGSLTHAQSGRWKERRLFLGQAPDGKQAQGRAPAPAPVARGTRCSPPPRDTLCCRANIL